MGSREVLERYEPHQGHGNTSKAGEEECTVWYDSRNGDILSIGPHNHKEDLPVHVRVDENGLLPVFTDGKGREDFPDGIMRNVLDAIHEYRESKLMPKD